MSQMVPAHPDRPGHTPWGHKMVIAAAAAAAVVF